MKDPTEIISIPANALLEFTQSEFDTWDTCAFKWYLQYAHRLDLVGGYSKALIIGDGIHQSFANWYSKKKNPIISLAYPEEVVVTTELERELEYMQVVLNATCEAYFEWYKDDLKAFKLSEGSVEQVVEVEFEYKGITIKLKGTLDLFTLMKTTQQVVDHKSCGVLNNATKDAWQFKFQFMFYVWLAYNSPTFRQKRPANFMVNGVKKTQLRQKQDESLAAFENRIYRDILARPADYFWREEMDFNKGSLERFEQELLFPKLDRVVVLAKASQLSKNEGTSNFLAINKNTNACWNWNRPCQFLPICSTSFAENVERYTVRPVKHNNYRAESLE